MSRRIARLFEETTAMGVPSFSAGTLPGSTLSLAELFEDGEIA